MFPSLFLLAALLFPLPEASTRAVFGTLGTREPALVLIDCGTGETQRLAPQLCAEKLPPCSTFKIWNSAIGLETGALTRPDQPFYRWDGQKREIADWNQDLTLKAAFRVSCVPAFQALARTIGAETMNAWLEKLNYGDRNTASGNDVFWLPAPGRQPLLISPDEQAALLVRLINGDLPFSKKTLAALKEIMESKKTPRGTLYGKTGTGRIGEGRYIAWFVGYAESGGRTVAFACALKGELMGPDLRTMVADLLARNGWL